MRASIYGQTAGDFVLPSVKPTPKFTFNKKGKLEPSKQDLMKRQMEKVRAARIKKSIKERVARNQPEAIWRGTVKESDKARGAVFGFFKSAGKYYSQPVRGRQHRKKN